MSDKNSRFATNRPPSYDSRSNRAASSIDRDDAPALGIRKVITQARKDLFGTKDVQNAITASYVWLADQLGHLTLGLAPTLLACWIIKAVGVHWALTETTTRLTMLAATSVIFLYWLRKELQDLADTRKNAGGIFPFDLSDIVWNVRTALLYFAIGGLLGVAAFFGFWWFLGIFVLSLWPASFVAFWWLRRKLAFQQAGLPYLYRLANFTGRFDRPDAKAAISAVSGLCDQREQPVPLFDVLLGRDTITRREPVHKHLLLSGPLRSGKTSLAVGIGTEFGFVLGLGRYLSAAKLLELASVKSEPQSEMDYDDGRVLWPWNKVNLLIVDDLDAAVALQAGDGQIGTVCRLVSPADFVNAMKAAANSPVPLSWLQHARSVWIIGDPGSEQAWRVALAELMGIGPEEILPMQLSVPVAASPSAQSTAPGTGRVIAGWMASFVGALLMLASVGWWFGESRWGAFHALTPGEAFSEGTLGLELAPLKYILVAGELSASALERPGGAHWPRRFGFLKRSDSVTGLCEANAPRNLPVGFGVSQRLPGNATPVPMRFVGLTCAACHSAELGRAGVILGAGSQTADVIGFTDAFLTAVMDPALSGSTIMQAYDKQCPAESGLLDGALWRPLETFFIDRWLAGARTQARINATKYDLPHDSAALSDPAAIPTGPSRTRPFRSVVRNTLDLPGADNRAYSKVPVAAMQSERHWSQFDGSIGDPTVRSLVAVFTSGASIAALNEPQVAYDIQKAAEYTLMLGQDPRWPSLREAFPEAAQPTRDILAAGKEVWDARCSSCHSPHTSPTPSITPVSELGTDPYRLGFRYAAMLPTALGSVLPMRDTVGQESALKAAESEAAKAGDYATADWFSRAGAELKARARVYPAGHRRAFSPIELAYRGGFLNAPIPFAWMRAPYLHNGSVPKLRQLVGLDERPSRFCRGDAGYDPIAIGIRAPLPTGGACPPEAPFLFDTAQPGNSNEGHRYPPPGEVSREDLEALVAYVGTL